MSEAFVPLGARDFTFLVCFPTTREGFQDAVADPTREFASLCGIPAQWENEIIKPAERFVRSARKLGATVRQEARTSDLEEVTKKGVRVVVLFSHWSDRGLEFFDGMKRPAEIVDSVAPRFDGLLDFSACGAFEAGLALERDLPSCRVRYQQPSSRDADAKGAELTPALWFLVFEFALRAVDRRRMAYGTALAEAARVLLLDAN